MKAGWPRVARGAMGYAGGTMPLRSVSSVLSPPRPAGPQSRPVESFDLVHPAVTPGGFEDGAGLEGLRILHLSDLHVRRHRARSRKFVRLCGAVSGARADLVAITGDCMDEPGQESAAFAALDDLAKAWSEQGPPVMGAYLVLGNHDSSVFAQRACERFGGEGGAKIRLLQNQRVEVAHPHGERGAVAVRLVGLSWPEDALGAMVRAGGESESGALTLVLAHVPSTIFTAADMGWPLVLAGHTHAGQVRLSPRFAPHTSSDVPVDLASGVLRYRSTLCCISRGVGDGMAEGLRINCPWQVPLYTLRHGPLPDVPRAEWSERVHQMRAW